MNDETAIHFNFIYSPKFNFFLFTIFFTAYFANSISDDDEFCKIHFRIDKSQLGILDGSLCVHSATLTSENWNLIANKIDEGGEKDSINLMRLRVTSFCSSSSIHDDIHPAHIRPKRLKIYVFCHSTPLHSIPNSHFISSISLLKTCNIYKTSKHTALHHNGKISIKHSE